MSEEAEISVHSAKQNVPKLKQYNGSFIRIAHASSGCSGETAQMRSLTRATTPHTYKKNSTDVHKASSILDSCACMYKIIRVNSNRIIGFFIRIEYASDECSGETEMRSLARALSAHTHNVQ